jgi:signal transduction histidine kinase
LNNPAAAVQRAAQHLTGELEQLLVHLPSPAARAHLLHLVDRPPTSARSPLQISDEEAEVEDWLADHGVSDAWETVPALVEAGIGVALLNQVGADVDLADATHFLAAVAAIRHSAADIVAGAGRISEIVAALRSYSYLDRAPIQEVDVVQGLEDTFVLLRNRTAGIHIGRDYEPELPRITASGAELNQVWTNLIENACDALAGTDASPALSVRARRDRGNVVVEVEDNGPGIPAELQPEVFERFARGDSSRSRAAGSTGLGLAIVAAVVEAHHGHVEGESRPGRTAFTVRLPMSSPGRPTAGA